MEIFNNSKEDEDKQHACSQQQPGTHRVLDPRGKHDAGNESQRQPEQGHPRGEKGKPAGVLGFGSLHQVNLKDYIPGCKISRQGISARGNRSSIFGIHVDENPARAYNTT
jgi:hypothetical protein